MDKNIAEIHVIISERRRLLNNLSNGIKESGPEQDFLVGFLNEIGFENTEETRYAAYLRISSLMEDGVLNHLETLSISQEEKDAILLRAYNFVAKHHGGLQEDLITQVENRKLLTPFYVEVLKWIHTAGECFNEFQKVWKGHLLDDINRGLEARFDNDKPAILDYLQANDLFDKGHGWEKADRCYSVLKKSGDGYVKLAYAEAFPEQIWAIITALETFAQKLSLLDDAEYGQKDAYIRYLRTLAEAFREKDTDALVGKWSQVDVEWMKIKGPVQITHPFEDYEDGLRQAVAPEWDGRIENTELFKSGVREKMVSMFEKIAAERGLAKDHPAYVYSLANIDRVQLYISAPAMYYGSHLNGLASAQVIPNDTIVSKAYGKKIFAYPEHILQRIRKAPLMKIRTMTLTKEIIDKKKAILFGEDIGFYRLYDIETVGHEFGHMLWVDMDTEIAMNEGGCYKKIEEWKATTGGLMAFFNNPQEDLKEPVVVDLVSRVVGLLDWMKLEEATPYYTEALIHLDILFECGMIHLDAEGKVALNFNPESYEAMKNAYSYHYGKLADAYIAKEDASIFLSNYAVQVGKYYLPTDPKLREFVGKYYALYEKIGNEVAEEA